MEDTHLTAEDVNAILAFVADEDPIIIGGQSISIWSQVIPATTLGWTRWHC